MTRINLAFAAALAGVLAGPALAQTAQTPAVTPAAPVETSQTPAADPAVPTTQAQTPVPDTGMKKTQAAHVRHRVHHRTHAKAADTSTPPAATQR